MRPVFFFVFLLSATAGLAQQKITGTVRDSVTGEGLPFANVSLKFGATGSATNEKGEFELLVPGNAEPIIEASYLGYRSALIIASPGLPADIYLAPVTYGLTEIRIEPKPPTYYIKLAMQQVKNNYPVKPFHSRSYYREKVEENDSIIKLEEGVFDSFYPSYTDTVSNQHELLLFRAADPGRIQFMKKEAEKRRKKEIRKAKRKGVELSPEQKEAFTVNFGGPQMALKMDFTKSNDEFLDSAEFKNFRYSFAGSSAYQGRELMVIGFESKGKIEHMRMKGKIYIVTGSWAITHIEMHGDFVIPLYLRPMMALVRLGVEKPVISQRQEFQEINGTWYPKSFRVELSGGLTRKHYFGPDDHSDFHISQVLLINKIDNSDQSPIPLTKRFNSRKKMKEQAPANPVLKWEEVNVISY